MVHTYSLASFLKIKVSLLIVGVPYLLPYVGTVYDSIMGRYFWLVDSTAGGNLFVSTNEEDTALQPILEDREEPFALSLDWIGRSLYWVEGVSSKLS